MGRWPTRARGWTGGAVSWASPAGVHPAHRAGHRLHRKKTSFFNQQQTGYKNKFKNKPECLVQSQFHKIVIF